ncbi:MAG: helix-turn-helix transcriptional regulator [Ruminococcaceae bacterium]|nr:helix-turn-helix transcriptional regulator [Oscillospiraceae bacterium]MBQ6873293.1 helix-turn-helix transcriptional regulator [Clostridia bacterium]
MVYDIGDKIKNLRERNNMTQTEMAKKLGITRSSVNGWEMGISAPSTQSIVELSKLFDVSTDYLLGAEKTATISISGLSNKDIELIHTIISHLRNINNQSE